MIEQKFIRNEIVEIMTAVSKSKFKKRRSRQFATAKLKLKEIDKLFTQVFIALNNLLLKFFLVTDNSFKNRLVGSANDLCC